MKRRFAAVLGLTAVILLGTGCGQTAPESAQKAAPAAEETAEAGAQEESAGEKASPEGGADTKAEKKDAAVSAGEEAPEEEAAEGAAEEEGFDVDAWYAELYRSYDEAYENGQMPAYELLPYVPYPDVPPEKPYESVTAQNLQGRWVNRYREGGVDFMEVLTVNGDLARIETFQDGVKKGVWNDEGYFSIEDRSSRHLCPAFRINDENGMNLCTIYIRWVKEEAFYDGGFLNEWKREDPELLADGYLMDTVTMENLQGIWYTDYIENESFFQVLLKVDGSRGWIMERKDGEPTSYWNGEGKVSLTTAEYRSFIHWPELLLDKDEGGNIAGIYISRVDDYAFYDVGLHNWYIRITEDRLREMGMLPEDYNITWLEDGGAKIVNTYTVTVHPKEAVSSGDEETCRRWSVTAEGADGVRGSFDAEISEDSLYVPDATGVAFEEDVNFDGLTDILLYKGAVGTHATSHYDCYLREGDQFVRCEGFDEIPDAWINPVDGIIEGTIRDGAAAYYALEYKIQGHEAVQVSETRYVYDEAQMDYVAE
ncbi:MAG: hypothetical protein K6E83_05245 [Clostridium sp.]|nr:hypothetical protein [Clostridium sp.]